MTSKASSISPFSARARWASSPARFSRQPSSVHSEVTDRSNPRSLTRPSRRSFAFSQASFILGCSKLWLHFLSACRHRIDYLSSRRRIRLVETVDDHLLAKAHDITKEPI